MRNQMTTTTKQAMGPNQTKWLAELRSGKYLQGDTDLRSKDDEYCCLGIACELFEVPRNLSQSGERYEYDGHSATAPSEVVAALALYSELGSSQPRDIDSLAGLNDSGKTFEEIADLVEKDPSQYFREPK